MTERLERAKADQIAALLGGTCAPLDREERRCDRFYITLDEPAGNPRIFIAGPSWAHKGRVCVHGNYPTYTRADGCTEEVRPGQIWVDNVKQVAPDITCGVERTAEQIAADIQRRFLPDFIHVWELCRERANDEGARVIARHETCERVAKLTGGRALREDKGVDFDKGSVTVDYDGLLTVKLEDVTEAALARILKARKA